MSGRWLLTGGLALWVAAAAMAAEPIQALTEKLGSRSVDEQVAAVQSLGELGWNAASAVPALVPLLKSEDLGLQIEVVMTLGRINSAPERSVPALLSVLPNPALQHAVLDALRRFGTDAETALPLLRPLVKSSNLPTAVAAAYAVTSISSSPEDARAALPVLIRGLSESESVAEEAVRGLALIGAPAVPALKTALTSASAETRLHAVDALASIGPAAHEAASSLIEVASGSEGDVAWHALRALPAIDAPAESAIPILVKGLSSEAVSVRTHAADALGHYGERAVTAVPALEKALTDKNELVRLSAATSLGEIGSAAHAAVPGLVKALDDEVGSVTIAAAGALGAIGKSAVPALVEKLNVAHFQTLAATILGRIGPDASAAVPGLRGLLKSSQVETQREAAIALASIGPAAKPAVGDLMALVEQESFPFRGAAAFALGRIGDPQAVPVLKKSIDAEDGMLRLASIWALIQFDPKNEEYIALAVPRLAEAVSLPAPRVRRLAVETLGKFGPRSAAAIPQLRQALQDEVPEIRTEAIVALAEIGAASAPAVPDLIVMVGSEDPGVCGPACYALGRIGADAKPAVAALKRKLHQRNAQDQAVTAWALLHIAPDADVVAVAVPLMIQALQNSPRPEVRAEAATTLGKVGKGHAAAADALKAASSKDANESVRKAAAAALQALGT